MYQRRYPRRHRALNLVSIVSGDTCSTSSCTRDRADGVRSQSQVMRSATGASSDCDHGVVYFDFTSNDFDVNQIQPPSPPPSPTVTHTGVRSQSQVLRSATSASSDCAHGVDYFDLTSNYFDVNQIQPPSPPPSPPVNHMTASGAVLPLLSIPPSSTSPLPSSIELTTDIEVIRTETVSLHNTISNTNMNNQS